MPASLACHLLLLPQPWGRLGADVAVMGGRAVVSWLDALSLLWAAGGQLASAGSVGQRTAGIGDFYIDFHNYYYVVRDFHVVVCLNGTNMGPTRSGMVPDHSQTLLGHFWKTHNVQSKKMEMSENHETSTGWKTNFHAQESCACTNMSESF